MDAVGLKMVFDVSTWPELLKKSRAGTLMMWGYSWSAASPDGGFFLAIAYGPNASEANDPRFSCRPLTGCSSQQRALPDGPEREAVMRQAKDHACWWPTCPSRCTVHNVAARLDLLQPWTQGYWRHPFMRDTWRPLWRPNGPVMSRVSRARVALRAFLDGSVRPLGAARPELRRVV
jgi:hypothetical protein